MVVGWAREGRDMQPKITYNDARESIPLSIADDVIGFFDRELQPSHPFLAFKLSPARSAATCRRLWPPPACWRGRFTFSPWPLSAARHPPHSSTSRFRGNNIHQHPRIKWKNRPRRWPPVSQSPNSLQSPALPLRIQEPSTPIVPQLAPPDACSKPRHVRIASPIRENLPQTVLSLVVRCLCRRGRSAQALLTRARGGVAPALRRGVQPGRS